MQTNAAPAAVALACWSCHFGQATQAVRVISTMVAALVLLEACSSLLLQGGGGGGGGGGGCPGGGGPAKISERQEKPCPRSPVDPKEPSTTSEERVNNGSRNAR